MYTILPAVSQPGSVFTLVTVHSTDFLCVASWPHTKFAVALLLSASHTNVGALHAWPVAAIATSFVSTYVSSAYSTVAVYTILPAVSQPGSVLSLVTVHSTESLCVSSFPHTKFAITLL